MLIGEYIAVATGLGVVSDPFMPEHANAFAQKRFRAVFSIKVDRLVHKIR